jgi:hypothetical protein
MPVTVQGDVEENTDLMEKIRLLLLLWSLLAYHDIIA